MGSLPRGPWRRALKAQRGTGSRGGQGRLHRGQGCPSRNRLREELCVLAESRSQVTLRTGALDGPVAWLGRQHTLRHSGESLPGSEVTKQTLTSRWLGGDPASSTPHPGTALPEGR